MEKVINNYDLNEYIKYLDGLFEEFIDNAYENANGKKVAGKRARKASLDLSKGLKQYRKYTLDRDKTLGRKNK